jgi:hypothetical protein
MKSVVVEIHSGGSTIRKQNKGLHLPLKPATCWGYAQLFRDPAPPLRSEVIFQEMQQSLNIHFLQLPLFSAFHALQLDFIFHRLYHFPYYCSFFPVLVINSTVIPAYKKDLVTPISNRHVRGPVKEQQTYRRALTKGFPGATYTQFIT